MCRNGFSSKQLVLLAGKSFIAHGLNPPNKVVSPGAATITPKSDRIAVISADYDRCWDVKFDAIQKAYTKDLDRPEVKAGVRMLDEVIDDIEATHDTVYLVVGSARQSHPFDVRLRDKSQTRNNVRFLEGDGFCHKDFENFVQQRNKSNGNKKWRMNRFLLADVDHRFDGEIQPGSAWGDITKDIKHRMYYPKHDQDLERIKSCAAECRKAESRTKYGSPQQLYKQCLLHNVGSLTQKILQDTIFFDFEQGSLEDHTPEQWKWLHDILLSKPVKNIIVKEKRNANDVQLKVDMLKSQFEDAKRYNSDVDFYFFDDRDLDKDLKFGKDIIPHIITSIENGSLKVPNYINFHIYRFDWVGFIQGDKRPVGWCYPSTDVVLRDDGDDRVNEVQDNCQKMDEEYTSETL